MTNIIFLILGLAAVLWGADRFTDGAGTLALKMNVPQIVVGLTIVAFGTSAPELCVSLFSALKGSSGLAIGNIVGSNIFNTLAIVGCAAVVAPIAISRNTVRKDMPFAASASVLLLLICLVGHGVPRWGAAVLLAGFVPFMVYTFLLARQGAADDQSGAGARKNYSTPRCVLLIVVGLACLIVGSNIFVDGATGIARSLGVSDAVIGLTIVSCGTSLPELATSVIAARKGQSGIAIGNVVGSNVFNILLILGLTGLVCPMTMGGITLVDLGVMTASMLVLWAMAYTRYRVERWEGAVLLLLFIGYISWLVVHA